MTRSYLLAVEIGPVQEFIAAARKTRDLWFGSHVVSEIAKAAARCLAERCGGASLVFPAPAAADALDPDTPLNVADVLLTEVPAAVVEQLGGEDQLDKLAAAAAAAVQARWQAFAQQAFDRARRFLREEIWHDQVDDVMECYAAWTPLDGNYPAARRRVMALLAGRTQGRNFRPSQKDRGVPKSSLDGARDSVLKRPRERQAAHCDSLLRLTTDEQLDVIGVTKRLAGRDQGRRPTYPSVSRIAADPWLRGVAQSTEAVSEFLRFQEICEELAAQDVLTRLDTDRFPQYAAFPYDGTAVFRSRYGELAEEAELLAEERTGLPEPLRALGRALRPLVQRHGEPHPYLAVLAADGDNLTATLDQLTSPLPDQHRRLSRQLAAFAQQVPQTIADHHGALVYAGGDDVLAFVPLDRVLDCAAALHDNFQATLQPALQELAISPGPTLSVGVGVGHFLESLEDLLELARTAEQTAKKAGRGRHPKNALCVRLQARGADPLSYCLNWDQHPHQRLQGWAELLLQGQLPDKAGYDLRVLRHVYRGWPAKTLAPALQADARRVLAQKRRSRPAPAEGLERIADLLQRVATVDDLLDLTDEIAIARRIAVALKQAKGKP